MSLVGTHTEDAQDVFGDRIAARASSRWLACLRGDGFDYQPQHLSSKRGMVGGQEDMLVDIAVDLTSDKQPVRSPR